MTNDKGILIKNIYYMLSYAFQVLRQSNYDEIASEEFDNIQNLFAAILCKGISQQLKQGLYREYVEKTENLTTLHGKLNMQETIKNKMQKKQVLACEYDELSENNIFNQIIKTTAILLLHEPTVDRKWKQLLKENILFFGEVDMVEPKLVYWKRLHFYRNNQNYQMLINICYFVIDGLLLTTENGMYKMHSFSDEHMARLFEKFVLEYYRQHYPELKASAVQIHWNVDDENDNKAIQFLPVMKTDITLRYKGKTLIIDTKHYAHTMQMQYDKYSLHSGNLYQIFTYVKNYDTKSKGNVAGLLLYAKTEERIIPDCEYSIDGNKISVKTLDLNVDFKLIAKQLDGIVEKNFEKIEDNKTYL